MVWPNMVGRRGFSTPRERGTLRWSACTRSDRVPRRINRAIHAGCRPPRSSCSIASPTRLACARFALPLPRPSPSLASCLARRRRNPPARHRLVGGRTAQPGAAGSEYGAMMLRQLRHYDYMLEDPLIDELAAARWATAWRRQRPAAPALHLLHAEGPADQRVRHARRLHRRQCRPGAGRRAARTKSPA